MTTAFTDSRGSQHGYVNICTRIKPYYIRKDVLLTLWPAKVEVIWVHLRGADNLTFNVEGAIFLSAHNCERRTVSRIIGTQPKPATKKTFGAAIAEKEKIKS